MFGKAVNYHDLGLAKKLRKLCVWEFLFGEGMSDTLREKFLLLAVDCDSLIKDKWFESHTYEYKNEFVRWLLDNEKEVRKEYEEWKNKNPDRDK